MRDRRMTIKNTTNYCVWAERNDSTTFRPKTLNDKSRCVIATQNHSFSKSPLYRNAFVGNI